MVHDYSHDASQIGWPDPFTFQQGNLGGLFTERNSRPSRGAYRVNVRRLMIVRVHHDPIRPTLSNGCHDNPTDGLLQEYLCLVRPHNNPRSANDTTRCPATTK